MKDLEAMPEHKELYDIEMEIPYCTITERWKEEITEFSTAGYPMYSEVGATGIPGSNLEYYMAYSTRHNLYLYSDDSRNAVGEYIVKHSEFKLDQIMADYAELGKDVEEIIYNVGGEEIASLVIAQGATAAVAFLFPEVTMAKYGAEGLVSFLINLTSQWLEKIQKESELEKAMKKATENLENSEILADISNNREFSHAVIIQVDIDGEAYMTGVEKLPTQATVAAMKVIKEAAIISQGEEAEGYQEAMEASYATAVENGSYDSYENFSQSYGRFAIDKAEQLQELSELSFTEIVERYDEFQAILDVIESNLNILG
ncbi:MAG: hypothetical protein ACK5LZ_06765 [Anaerorhabdus sp.]